MNDKHLDPPEPCPNCEKYYVYRDGLCWECWHDGEEDRAYDKWEAKQERERDEQNIV